MHAYRVSPDPPPAKNYAEQIIDTVTHSTADKLMEWHPNSILQALAACSEETVGKERWDVIKARGGLLVGSVIAQHL